MNHAQDNISFPRLLAAETRKGYITAKHLSSDTQTRTLELRYKQKARANKNTLQAIFPASHSTVILQPT